MKVIFCLLTITCLVLVSFSQTKIVKMEKLRLTYYERVISAQQQYISARKDVQRSEVEVIAAQREWNRRAKLVEIGVMSKPEYDQAKDRLQNAIVSLRTANVTLETRRLAMNEAYIRFVAEINNAKNKSFSSKPQNKTQQKPKVIKKPKNDSAVKTTLPLNVFEKPTIIGLSLN
jgi:hypothetical protein